MTNAIVWLTGPPCAGKSTLARALGAALQSEREIDILDGDEVRRELSPELGFSKADRDRNVRRMGYVARRLAHHGVLVIVAAVSPYRETRDEVRQRAQGDGLIFLEVFVTASDATLRTRDTKGMYRKALAGELAAFTGVSDPYEPPVSADVTVQSDRESVDESVKRVMEVLRARRVLGPE